MVSAIGMGRGSQPVKFGEPLEESLNSAIHRALDLGVDLLDSSDAYWGTRHEVLLGRALKGRRDEAQVITKFGNLDLPDGRKGTNGKPEFVHECCDASLKRLGIDVIDIFFMHRVDPDTPIEETIGAMARLIEQGKVRHIGVCEASAATLRRAHKAYPLVALQSEYSLWYRDPEDEILPTCRELGIAYIAYAPLGRGLLTGRIRDVEDIPAADRRRKHPRFKPENLARNLGLVRELEAMAEAKHATSAQLALAWLLAQGEDIVPIPGTNHAHNVDLNVAAVDIELNAADLQRLNQVFAPGAGAGARYAANALKGVGI